MKALAGRRTAVYARTTLFGPGQYFAGCSMPGSPVMRRPVLRRTSTPPRAGHAHPKAHDGTITTEAPDVMWGTDMTATVTVAEGPAFVFVAVENDRMHGC